MTVWHPAFALAELAAGTMRAVTVGARELVVCRTDTGCFALDNTCTHAEARMVEGRLRGTRLVCPLHGGAFDVRSGAVLGGPASCPLPVHPLRIVDGRIEIGLED
jgi:nitrite reductase/ring-hydroxylating ferredoxin subunit